MAKPEFVERDKVCLSSNQGADLFAKGELEVLDFSKVTIKLKGFKLPLDIGAICYSKRLNQNSGLVKVLKGSLVPKRKQCVASIVESIAFEVSNGKRATSIRQEVRCFLRFIDWTDRSGLIEVLSSLEDAQKCFLSYLEHMKERLRQNTLSIITAVSNQNYVCKWLAIGLSIDEAKIVEGVALLRKDMSSVNSTQAPTNSTAKYQLSVYESIFQQLSEIILKKKPLPQLLELPNESVWLMPQKKLYATKSMLARRNTWKNRYSAYDYENGCISKPEDIIEHYAHINYASAAVSGAYKLQKSVNSDSHHFIRIFIFNLLQSAFYNLFIANTGMNPSLVHQLKWDDDYNSERKEYGFRAIKYRAGGKEVTFNITSKFLLKFKLFLEVRSFIVNGQSANLLFLPITNKKIRHTPNGRDYFAQIARKHFASLIGGKPITAREWRAYKAVKVLSQTGGNVNLTASSLQNTPSTFRKYYGNISDEDAGKQFSRFFDKLLTKSKELIAKTPSGGCKAPNQPKPESEKISPDCRAFEYCLFCENYALHGGEADIRKLLSMKYVILQSRHLASSQEHFDNLFSSVISRVDLYVDELAKKGSFSCAYLNSIKDDIEKENLDTYWQGKLDLLVKVGAI